jgi:nicotinamide mononucleotide adenylyltransferase
MYNMVHGRFQGFHNEHLDYVLSHYGEKHLIIGITNPEPSEFKFVKNSPHRHNQKDNPFTYFERMTMIQKSLYRENIDMNYISITPFHLWTKDKWNLYLPNPNEITQHVRIFSDWEKEKVKMFEEEGFIVKTYKKIKTMEAQIVRKRIRNNENWQELVPNGSQEIINYILSKKSI